MLDYEEIGPGIFIYYNIIDNYLSVLDNIKDITSNGPLRWGKAAVKSKNTNGVDEYIRDTGTFGVPYFEDKKEILEDTPEHLKPLWKLSNIFYENFNPVESHYKGIFGIDTETHDTYGVLKYGIGQKFTNHIDDHNAYPRKVSTVYYLNDDYSGGEIIFPRFNIKYKPKANSMIIFPSAYTYNHSVLEVTDGNRYAVVSWLK